MIDITKPLELEDGRSCIFCNMSYRTAFDEVPHFMISIEGVKGRKAFHPTTGKHYFNEYPKLRNKIMKLVDVNKPVTVGGKEAKIIHVFDNGNLAVVVDGWAEVQNYNQYGQANGEGAIILVNAVQITERWVNVYPTNGNCHYYASQQCLVSSAHDAFQVKQTLHDGVVVSSEVVG